MPLYFCKGILISSMQSNTLLPHLFRTEYQKIVSVLCYLFGIEHIETAEDIVSDTFLAATEQWSMKGVPENPTAWLYTVAKNKTKNYLKRDALFRDKIMADVRYKTPVGEEIDIDLSSKNITDSQLAMIFTVCDPVIPRESQVALALNLLCGFGAQEIADAYLTNKEVVYKRLSRAKDKLKEAQIRIEQPSLVAIQGRLDNVLTTLYLLFSEGYYSTSQNTTLRKDLCLEAMRLNYLLIENETTNTPAANALLALMCFHASRFDARIGENGEIILYEDQDETLWNRELIERGGYYLEQASTGTRLTKYHLEAAIAYWHTIREDNAGKWEHILELYNELLILEYSPIAALNRTFAVSKVHGKMAAIREAEKLELKDNYFYYSLLGHLFTNIDNQQALTHFETAHHMAVSQADKAVIQRNTERLRANPRP